MLWYSRISKAHPSSSCLKAKLIVDETKHCSYRMEGPTHVFECRPGSDPYEAALEAHGYAKRLNENVSFVCDGTMNEISPSDMPFQANPGIRKGLRA